MEPWRNISFTGRWAGRTCIWIFEEPWVERMRSPMSSQAEAILPATITISGLRAKTMLEMPSERLSAVCSRARRARSEPSLAAAIRVSMELASSGAFE